MPNVIYETQANERPASIAITPVQLPTCSPRASGCRSTCTSSTIPLRACWSTPA